MKSKFYIRYQSDSVCDSETDAPVQFRNVSLFLIYDQDSNHPRYITQDGQTCTIHELKENKQPKPYLQMPAGHFQALVSAVLEYAENLNIQPKGKDYIQGKLESTEKHLLDLRQLLKLK